MQDAGRLLCHAPLANAWKKHLSLTQAKVRLQNWKSFNLTDMLPGGVTFQDPMFFDNQASNVTSATKVKIAFSFGDIAHISIFEL